MYIYIYKCAYIYLTLYIKREERCLVRDPAVFAAGSRFRPSDLFRAAPAGIYA